MAWKPEVIANNTGKWYGNGLRFATKGRLQVSAKEPWTAIRS
jgi:hypothetical protein